MRGKTLAQRIALVILLPLLLASLALGAFLIHRHAEDMRAQRLESARATIGQFATLAELPLATGSRVGVREAAEFMQKTAAPLGLAMFDRGGVSLESHGNVGAFALKTLAGKPLGLQIEMQSSTLDLVQPVFLTARSQSSLDGGRTAAPTLVGYVTLAFSNATEDATLTKLWINGVGILLIAGVLTYLFAYRVLRGITRPLGDLSVAFERVKSGDLDARVGQGEGDDLRRLTANFNAMAVELKSARQHLRREIDAATVALAKRTAEAEAANQAKSRFLAAASHDLRQPAHALSLYIAALRQTLKRRPEEESVALLPAVDGMQAASKSLDALLNALLDISRFDAGVVQAQKITVALDELVREAVMVLASGAEQRGLRLRVRAPALEIESDPTLLRRVIDNLLSNAIRFTRSGCILVAVRPRADHLLLQVWDQGVGIAASELPLVFDEFYQVKRGEIGQGGMGLGLAIVARSVNLLGGNVAACSVPNRGSRFTVRLSVAPRRRIAMQPATTALSPIARGDKILILDDDPLVRDSMRAAFDAHGYEAIARATFDELCAAMTDGKKIAAAVVDYRLHDGFTGIEAARRLRDLLGDAVPIVMVTGDTSVERLRLLRESNFPVAHKPIDIQRLLKAINANALIHKA